MNRHKLRQPKQVAHHALPSVIKAGYKSTASPLIAINARRADTPDAAVQRSPAA